MSTIDIAHKQWATRPADERFQTLEALSAKLKTRRRDSKDGRIDMREVTASVNGEFTLSGKMGKPARFNHWTAGQFLQAISVPRDLLSRLTPRVATDVVNDRIARALADEDLPKKQRILFELHDDTATIRALHGNRYERVWDDDVVDVVRKWMPEGWRNPVAYEHGKFGNKLVPSGLYAGDRDLFITLIDGGDWAPGQPNVGSFDVDGEQFNQGLVAWNGETGAKGLGFMTLMFDVMCGNHYFWGAKDVSIVQARHAGQAYHVLEGLKKFLQVQGSVKGIASQRQAFALAVKEAKATVASSVTRSKDDTLDTAYSKFGRVAGITKPIIRDALDAMLREEKGVKGTAYDWLAGFTAVAREMPNADDRNKLEMTASKLLLASK